ncbi:MAG: pilus assembly protein [Dermatophilaceae bacterium]
MTSARRGEALAVRPPALYRWPGQQRLVPSLRTQWFRLRMRWSRLRRVPRDGGRAIVEFVFLGVLVLVPLIYLVVTVGRIQAAAFSATSAAREAGRAFTTSEGEGAAFSRARAAAALSFEDFGFAEGTRVDLECDGTPCLRPDARVTVTASVSVPLPLVPAFLDGALPLSVPVSSTHVSTVDRFGGR